MTGAAMLRLANGLAEAKNRQDVQAALEFLHEDMVLETPAFGTRARGRAANEQVLTAFFSTFPDYHVELDDFAHNTDTLVCWGTAMMTMTGDRFGVTPNGDRAELPVFIEFQFADDLIVRERFYFDLAELCTQSGVSTDVVRAQLFPTPTRRTSR